MKRKLLANMKSIVFSAILLLVFGAVWALYLHYGNRRFEESLPKLPKANTVTHTEDVVSPTDQGHITFEPSATIDASADSSDIKEEYTDTQPHRDVPPLPESVSELEFPETSELDEIEFFDFPEIPQQPQGVSLRDWLSRLSKEELEAVYTEKTWLKPVSEMTYEEKVAEVNRRRQQLIDLYGNSPEVEVFNKYVTVSSLIGEPQIIAPEDIVMHAKGLSLMFPTIENIQHYQDMKAGEERGWHIQPNKP